MTERGAEYKAVVVEFDLNGNVVRRVMGNSDKGMHEVGGPAVAYMPDVNGVEHGVAVGDYKTVWDLSVKAAVYRGLPIVGVDHNHTRKVLEARRRSDLAMAMRALGKLGRLTG